MTLLKWENGFTMIEMLFSLTITLIVAHLFLQAMLVVQPMRADNEEVNPLEWELFLHSLKREVKKAENTTVVNGNLYLHLEDRQYSVEKYRNLLRQRVNGAGHVVLLHNVKSYAVEKEGHFIHLTVYDLSDRKYSAKLLYYHEAGVIL